MNLLQLLRLLIRPRSVVPSVRRALQGDSPAEDAAKLVAVRSRADAIVAEARNEAETLRRRALDDEAGRKETLGELAQRIEERQQRLSARIAILNEREQRVRQQADELQSTDDHADDLHRQRLAALEQRAGLTREDAATEVLAATEHELREDAERRLRLRESLVVVEAERRARTIISTTVQRLSPPIVPEGAADPLHSASPDAKQRLLARDGHTLRAIELATGCELAVEDIPGAAPSITLAGFDPVRREVARTALTWLIRDGASNPAKVEAIILRAQREVAASIERAGLIAATEAACKDLPSEVLQMLGRLRYRTSYGQNQLRHAIETSRLGAMLAHELGADVDVLRYGALLHDLGKAIDRDNEGTHAMLGAEVCRRNGMPDAIVHCIAAHHEEIEPQTLEARLTIIADSISGGRPGARRESLERYLARLAALEDVAHSFNGVERAFAIQAGRELRILVRSDQLDDQGAAHLAKAVSETIQDKLEYPGQIRVTVVRETRAVEYAR